LFDHEHGVYSVLKNVAQARMYMRLPLNAASRLWGRVNNVSLPLWARRPAYNLYISLFHCNMSEVAVTDLRRYHNLGEFFRRQLKPSCRPVDQTCSLVCLSTLWWFNISDSDFFKLCFTLLWLV